MKNLAFIWSFTAFSILGLDLLHKTEIFDSLQNFENDFNPVNHPEEFLPNWSANEVSNPSSRVFQATGEGLEDSNALGIQPIGSFNAEIYTKTTTIGLESNRISLKAKTKQNGSGNRPVYLYYTFLTVGGENLTDRQQIGKNDSFRNIDSPYQEYDFFIPDTLLEMDQIMIKLEAIYGPGSGTAARLFIDEFKVHGLANEEPDKLEILSVEVNQDKNLILNFSHPIKFTAEYGPTSISLNQGYGHPEKAVVEGQRLQLEFSDYLYSNSYEFTFSHLASATTEETWMEKTHAFDLLSPIPTRSILINEFMPDPNPKGLQPEQPFLPNSSSNEYIELFNATEKPINLEGLTCNGGVIADFVLAAKAYVIITSADHQELFSPYGQVLGISSFKTLANSAGQIIIEDAFGNLVDSLSYTADWYIDQQKATGGWSLERINPFQNCNDASNWSASASPQGGTPGKANSVYDESPDTGPFFINRIQPISPKEITVYFSKPIQEESVQGARFSMGKETLLLKSSQYQSLTFSLPVELVSGNEYFLQVKDLYGCNGLLITGEAFPFTYDIESPKILRVSSLSPEELKVFFNETLEKSASEKEENYLINGKKDGVQTAQLEDSTSVSLQLSSRLSLNQQHFLIAQHLADKSGNISGLDTLEFLMDDQLDTAIIPGPSLLDLYFHTEVDSLSTSTIINYTVDKDIGHPNAAFRDAENFRLVHLVFNQDLPHNEPGTVTIQNIRDISENYINTHKKTFLQDNRPITLSTLEPVNDSTVRLNFNKPLEPLFAEIAANYTVNENMGHPILATQTDSTTVTLLFEEKFEEGKTYQLSIIGLRDIYGVEITRTTKIDFQFDLSAPLIKNARLLNPFDIILEANEAIVLPDEKNISILNQESLRRWPTNDQEFVISSPLALTADTVRILIRGLTDIEGNKADSIRIDIPNEKINLGSAFIVKEDLIQLAFTAEADPVSAINPSHYAIKEELPQEVRIGENQYEIFLHLRKPLSLLDSVILEVKQLKSKDGKQNQELSDTLFYGDGIEDLYVLNPRLIQIVHHTPLAKDETEKGVFILKDQKTKIQPLVNQSDQRLLQLVLEQPLAPDIFYGLTVPPRTTIDQQNLSGSTRTVIWDKSAPKLTVIEALNENELLVTFNEELDPILSLVTAFYHLDDQEPLEVVPGDLPNQVILVFPEIFEEGLSYELLVVQVEDLHRNAIVEERLEFLFDGPVLPLSKEIIINELMAAPRAGNPLPHVEYVELYNASGREVFLGGLFLSNSRNATVLPRERIAAGEYLILAPANQQEAMESYGRTIGLSNWPTLLNEGDEIKLLDKKENILDEVSYNSASYGTPEKSQEGFSLEVVNPFAPCPEPDNLRPSESIQKGTPGKINSVFDDTPDKTPLFLLKAIPKDGNVIDLEFSERLNSNLDQVTLKLSPSVEILGINRDTENPNHLMVKLNGLLKENQQYQITIENIRDCSGNPIDPVRNSVDFKIPAPAEAGDILLSEILFNARTDAPKFVEIYNQTDKYISLNNWKLANMTDGEIGNRKPIVIADPIIGPFSYLVFTTDASGLQREYPNGKPEAYVELSSLPSYPVGGGTVILLNQEEDLEERFDYDEKFHHSLLAEVKGVSLERYSLDHGVNDPENWHSASSTVGYATPGYKNSQSYLEGILERGITISPKVFVPDAPGEQNFTTINYAMEKPGYVATLRIYNISGQLVQELCQNDVWGNSGFYTWDGTDMNGKKVRPGYFIVWVEAINLEGSVENIKKTVVVGSKF